MLGTEGTGDNIGSTIPLRSTHECSSADYLADKLKRSSVKIVNLKKFLPSISNTLRQGAKRLGAFSSIRVAPAASREYLTKPESTIVSAEIPFLSNKPDSNNNDSLKENNKVLVASRLVDRESTDLQIKCGKKKESWQELKKIANPTNKKAISDKGFKRLMAALNEKDISCNNNLKLMVLFAAHSFEKKELSPDQMKQYVDILVNKYTIARAEEQVEASVRSLVPTGSEKKYFDNNVPLKASESVQIAEIIATTCERLDATDASDIDSGVVHNYKRDFPLSLYGWELDFENISRAVDTKLLEIFPKQLRNSLVRDAGSEELAATAEFEKQLVEGIHRSINEFADSLLRSARSSVDNPIKKDTSVRQSEKNIKTKLAKRREKIVAVLQQELGEGVANQAMQIPIDKIVDHKIKLWIRKYEEKSDENDQSVVMTKAGNIPNNESKNGTDFESIEINIENFELPEDQDISEWSDLLLSYYSEDEQQRIDKKELIKGLTEKAQNSADNPSLSFTEGVNKAVVKHEQKAKQSATSKPAPGVRQQRSVKELIDFFEAAIEQRAAQNRNR